MEQFIDADNDVLLVMMVPSNIIKLHPRLAGSFQNNVRIWVPSGGIEQAVAAANPNCRVMAGGLDLEGCRTLMKGVSSLLMNTPSGHDDEVLMASNMIQACQENMEPKGKFAHLVFSSILQPSLSGIGSHATNKLAIEERIVQSGLPYTIVHVAPLIDWLLTPPIIEGKQSTISSVREQDLKFSYITRKDVAAALERILRQRQHHYYATYQLVGTENPIGLREIVTTVKRTLGFDLQIRRFAGAGSLGPLDTSKTTADADKETQMTRRDALGEALGEAGPSGTTAQLQSSSKDGPSATEKQENARPTVRLDSLAEPSQKLPNDQPPPEIDEGLAQSIDFFTRTGVGMMGNQNTLKWLLKDVPESVETYLIRRKRELARVQARLYDDGGYC